MLAACLVLLTCAGALACRQGRMAPSRPVDAVASRIDVFVQARGRIEGSLRVRVETVHVRDTSGVVHELGRSLDEMVSSEVSDRRALAGGVVPRAQYEAVLLTLSEASLVIEGRARPLSLLPADGDERPAPIAPDATEDVPPVTYEIPLALELRQHDAASVFLDWDVDLSLVAGDGLRPQFGVSLERPHIRLGLLYVADEATGSVLAVERGSGQVLSTGKVGEAPRALAVARNRRDLYVANAGDGSISLFDLQRSATEFTIPISLGARTSDIVIADDGRLVATCNPGLNTVSLFDPRFTSRVADVRVGREPVRLVAAPGLRRLFVANRQSDELSIVDLSSNTVIATVPAEAMPSDVALDRKGGEVYVGHSVSQNLLVVDAESLLVTESIYVGSDVTALLTDRRRDRIYVARDRPTEIAIVDRRLSAVVRRIPVAGRIEALAQPIDGPLIYGAAPDQGGLVVVDVILGRELPLIPCGTAPSHVVAVD
ncbi:MAG: YncE family protein [Planctomycetota bacterium]